MFPKKGDRVQLINDSLHNTFSKGSLGELFGVKRADSDGFPEAFYVRFDGSPEVLFIVTRNEINPASEYPCSHSEYPCSCMVLDDEEGSCNVGNEEEETPMCAAMFQCAQAADAIEESIETGDDDELCKLVAITLLDNAYDYMFECEFPEV